MKYKFTPMNDKYADSIIADWHYDGIYSFYDMAADEEDLKIFTNKEYWRDTIFAVLNDSSELVGWSSFYIEYGDLWLSLGLRPSLTGQGLGKEFVVNCVKFAKTKYAVNIPTIKLEVASFNQRAIKVYKRVGFIVIKMITKHTHIGELNFLQMEKSL